MQTLPLLSRRTFQTLMATRRRPNSAHHDVLLHFLRYNYSIFSTFALRALLIPHYL